MQSRKTKPSATSLIYFQVHDGARGTCRPPTVHSMNSFICGLERTIPKMGSRNFHLLIISNEQCGIAGSLMIWFVNHTWKLKTHWACWSYLRFLQAETPVLLALQPLQAPFQQVVPPLHTPKLPELGGWTNPSETFESKWESSPPIFGMNINHVSLQPPPT